MHPTLDACRRYFDYRSVPRDGDCPSLGTFLEFDCRNFNECPFGMQEVGSAGPSHCLSAAADGLGAASDA